MWMDYEGYGMGWHWLGWLGMAFFWLIPILLVLAVVKYLMDGRRSNTPSGEKKARCTGCTGGKVRSGRNRSRGVSQEA